MSLAAWAMFALFFVWSFLGMPIGYAMLASSIVYLFATQQDIALVATQSLNGLYGSFVLLAVPLFIRVFTAPVAGVIADRLRERSIVLLWSGVLSLSTALALFAAGGFWPSVV